MYFCTFSHIVHLFQVRKFPLLHPGWPTKILGKKTSGWLRFSESLVISYFIPPPLTGGKKFPKNSAMMKNMVMKLRWCLWGQYWWRGAQVRFLYSRRHLTDFQMSTILPHSSPCEEHKDDNDSDVRVPLSEAQRTGWNTSLRINELTNLQRFEDSI